VVRTGFVLPLSRVKRWLLITVICLVLLDFLASYLSATRRLTGFARFFDGDVKTNFPSSFKIVALFAATILLWLITRASSIAQDGCSRYWRHLAAVFALLTVDEMTYLHQSLSSFLHRHLGGSGYLHYSWQVLYLSAAGLLGLYFIPFFLRLDGKTRLGLLGAAFLFGGGSGGLEFLKAKLDETPSWDDKVAFKLVAAVSDSCEMLGLTILLLVLIAYFTARVSEVAVQAGLTETKSNANMCRAEAERGIDTREKLIGEKLQDRRGRY
jgi:hypothetical protein